MCGPKPARGLWAGLKHAFTTPRDSDLTDRQRDWLSKIARKVADRGLSYPALLVLESAQPLSYIGSQVVVFFKPVISALFPHDVCDEVVALLERRGTLKFLARSIRRCDAAKRTGTARDEGEA